MKQFDRNAHIFFTFQIYFNTLWKERFAKVLQEILTCHSTFPNMVFIEIT